MLFSIFATLWIVNCQYYKRSCLPTPNTHADEPKEILMNECVNKAVINHGAVRAPAQDAPFQVCPGGLAGRLFARSVSIILSPVSVHTQELVLENHHHHQKQAAR